MRDATMGSLATGHEKKVGPRLARLFTAAQVRDDADQTALEFRTPSSSSPRGCGKFRFDKRLCISHEPQPHRIPDRLTRQLLCARSPARQIEAKVRENSWNRRFVRS